MGDDDGDGGDGSEEVYSGKTKPALVSVSDSYSDDEAISVSDSRYSSYPAYTVTDYFLSTGYCSKKCKQFWSKKTILL